MSRSHLLWLELEDADAVEELPSVLRDPCQALWLLRHFSLVEEAGAAEQEVPEDLVDTA